MKSWLMAIIVVICFGVVIGCVDYLDDESKNTTTTESVEPQIANSIQCVNVGADDNTITLIEANGYDVDFRDGVWYIDNVMVGYSDHEDESFALCGDVLLMETWLPNG